MANSNQKFNIKEGTISFWIKEGQIIYDNDILYSLVDIGDDEGVIMICKDFDKKLKFFHISKDKGRVGVEWDCSTLKSDERHMITATWSYTDKRIKLYVDGENVGESKIKD